MKSKEEIERLAFLEYPRLINDTYNPMEDDNTYERKIWIGAYTQCQEDITKTMSKEIQPEEIWNKESQEKIKEHILNLAKKQTPKDRLETELMAKKYKSEDYATKIMEVAYYGFPLVQRKETVHKIINALLIEYAEQK